MVHLIDKSALVADIERKRDICKKVILDLRSQENKDYYQGKVEAYEEALSFLDTTEAKEVDLDKEIKSYFKGFGKFPSVGIDDCIDIAKHFFELGLAQKGERV